MADVALLKQLVIKTGVVNRLSKEVSIYNQEVKELIAKRAKLEEEGTQEEWFVKNATKMIAESEKMITDTQDRLKAGIIELESVVKSAKETDLIKPDAPELVKAEEMLASVKETKA